MNGGTPTPQGSPRPPLTACADGDCSSRLQELEVLVDVQAEALRDIRDCALDKADPPVENLKRVEMLARAVLGRVDDDGTPDHFEGNLGANIAGGRVDGSETTRGGDS